MAHSSLQKHTSKSKRKSTSRSTSKSPTEDPPITPMSESHENEVMRMRNEFSTLLTKWSDIQQQLADTLETPRPPPTTTEVAEPTPPICSPTNFIRHRMTRSATPPPTMPTMRMGELSMHSTASNSTVSTFRTDRPSMIATSDDEDAMKVPDAADVEEKDRQIEQQRETIEELKQKIASLEKENHNLVLQNAAEKDAVIRDTTTAVDRMSTSLAAMQQDMKALSTSDREIRDQSVTKEHLEKLTTNQLEEHE